MVSATEIITQHGQANAASTVRAAVRTGIPVWIAAAVIEKETNGANIFGHDRGGAMYGAGEVTEAKYREFRRLIDAGHTSNGVGPAQITYPGFFREMDKQGLKPWVPDDNIYYGMQLMASYLRGNWSNASIRSAGGAYNGNISYGDSLVQVAAKWRARLEGASTDVPAASSGKKSAYMLVGV